MSCIKRGLLRVYHVVVFGSPPSMSVSGCCWLLVSWAMAADSRPEPVLRQYLELLPDAEHMHAMGGARVILDEVRQV
eukprot:scaffold22957_cov169-Isochrysis_galbana.AAC.1